MKLYDNDLYMEDVRRVAGLPLPWEKLSGKDLLISGASGMIGSFAVDVLMEKNSRGLGCHVYAMGRSRERLESRFSAVKEEKLLSFMPYDINKPLEDADVIRPGCIILHLASNTHPLQYATDPVGTITTNIIGLMNLLEYGKEKKAGRILFASSNEIYGENRGDTQLFAEDYCGYIDSNTLRAGYPESKRCAEALCQAYIKAHDMDIVIPRLTRSYGPTMLMTDTKAISQFIRKGVAGEDIVLKSEGTQLYSYTYVSDAVSGLLTVLLLGEKGEAYNIADEASDIALKDLAAVIADTAGKKVVFELPDATEAAGYSKATKALLDGAKLKNLGWQPVYDIGGGIPRTIKILQEITQ
ncbi:MAG: NAD-dependent epimerase/dehydratase family protein [Lachnospiraceae bacterium]|nr:NAD-dependent epimerase/dehydratase family protein [Lachnospiraceae bacterium]